jgi:hypothetical protein
MAVVQPTAGASIDTLEGSHESIVILIAMIVIFSAAAFFTGRLYGRNGMIAVIAGFFVVLTALYSLGAINFG